MTNLDRYKHYCSILETTPLYIEYSFYSLISACLQRRVWCSEGDWKIYPNLYIIFVGNPGTGKTVSARVNMSILGKIVTVNQHTNQVVDKIPIAPDVTTVEALINKLATNTRIFRNPETNADEAHSSLSFISEELGVLFKEQSQDVVRFLIQGFDCGDFTKETRHQGCDKIKKMCLNFLGATQPGWIRSSLNRGLLDDGFLGRALFISGGKPKPKTFFEPGKDQLESLSYVQKYCNTLSNISGPVRFSPKAKEYLINWHEKGGNQVINPDKKLLHYYARKKINVIKLSIITHMADRCDSSIIEVESIEKALEALKRAEMTMHEALASVTKNPVHILALSIEEYLNNHKGKFFTSKELWLLFHDEAEGGKQQIDGAIEFLMLSEKLRTKINSTNELTYGVNS